MDSKMTGLTFKLHEMASRIRELRLIEGWSEEDMAVKTGVSLAEYIACEAGEVDLNFAFLYRCASALSVDVTDIIEGTSPRLSRYTLTRSGAGQRIEQAHGMIYYNLAAQFRNRATDPLFVRAEYSREMEYGDIELTSHSGQECDIVLQGKLKIQIGEHIEVLSAGDSIYYDSSTPHGMVAVGGEDAWFYAIVIKPTDESAPAKDEKIDLPVPEVVPVPVQKNAERVWEKYINAVENSRGALQAISFNYEDTFNFAFDIVDEIAKKQPDKLALLHISRDKEERRFTFKDISRESNRAANYFSSLGIKKGDRVMLVLKRHYQFWICMMGLCKLGAIAIPATNQLKEKDFEYRFNKAGINTIIITPDGDVAEEAAKAADKCTCVINRLMVNSARAGWRSFDEEYKIYSSHYFRTEDSACGDDRMLMYFTSGTTGNPKIASHSFKYPLGHFITARYWQCVNPEGLHLTISDTGWAKAAWGKLYGQWLNEAAVFAYDFDRFDAADILPMFGKYHITTFCAPPTMYRMLIREDITKYDLSSIEHATIAGEALNPEVYLKFQEATGLKLMEGFGQSESTVMIGNLIGTEPKMGSMGKPVPLYDIDIVNEQGMPVAAGETGEIVARIEDGLPCGLATDYYRDEEKTAETWKDGLYHTGDTAWRDEDGYYRYVGRVDDVIKSSGYRIGPFEIESVLMELPYILECGVTAAPDPIRGQVVKATIVLKGKEPSDELKKEIQDYVKRRTAPYKYPRIIVFSDGLPKTVSGKIMRNKL